MSGGGLGSFGRVAGLEELIEERVLLRKGEEERKWRMQ